MARTITIDDDTSAVVVALTIEDGASDLGPRVTSLHIDARNGGALAADDLRVLEQFGLRLPAPGAPPRPARVAPVRPPRPALPAAGAVTPVGTGTNEIRRWYDSQPAAWRMANQARTGFPSKTIMDGYRAAHGLPLLAGKYPRPSDEKLVAAIAEVGVSQTRLAQHFGVPGYVSAGWLKHLRNAGLTNGK